MDLKIDSRVTFYIENLNSPAAFAQVFVFSLFCRFWSFVFHFLVRRSCPQTDSASSVAADAATDEASHSYSQILIFDGSDIRLAGGMLQSWIHDCIQVLVT